MEKPYYLKYFKAPKDDRLIASVHCYYPLQSDGVTFDTGFESSTNYNELMDSDMNMIAKFVSDTGIPVFIGEYASSEERTLNERIEEAVYVYQKGKDIGVPVFWWECGWYEWEPDKESFSLYDRKKMEWVWPQIVKAVMDIVHRK